jgi:hypothetical protein
VESLWNGDCGLDLDYFLLIEIIIRWIDLWEPGTPAKKKTIPRFPFPPLISKGFPPIKNLGSF